MSPAIRAAAGGRPGRLRSALLALSSPLVILLALLALLHRTGSDRIQAVPALLIGVGLLLTSMVLRRRRRREILRALRQERIPEPAPDASKSS
ncbi:MAG: DUF3188 domain-containing protein [Cyanobacteriota bacterium]